MKNKNSGVERIWNFHPDVRSRGARGFVRGPDLSEELLKPALRAAEKILPRDPSPVIDGFDARDGVIHRGYEGILAAPPELRPRPFEIVFETARHAPLHLQVEALLHSIKAILNEYRQLVAFAPNL